MLSPPSRFVFVASKRRLALTYLSGSVLEISVTMPLLEKMELHY